VAGFQRIAGARSERSGRGNYSHYARPELSRRDRVDVAWLSPQFYRGVLYRESVSGRFLAKRKMASRVFPDRFAAHAIKQADRQRGPEKLARRH
jgi:hypothetical protein